MGWTPPRASVCQGDGVELSPEGSVHRADYHDGTGYREARLPRHGADAAGRVVFRDRYKQSRLFGRGIARGRSPALRLQELLEREISFWRGNLTVGELDGDKSVEIVLEIVVQGYCRNPLIEPLLRCAKRVHPGTCAAETTLRHLAWRNGRWNTSNLLKKASTIRATLL